ncbi:hypothetical protein niasHT_029165 [Heterodera trifolii]|uniref:Uncharacterized protein n=1 Tax=Heterodera trifolii TaxID=157864 RepID=A0ABD2JYE1_9BILA
MSAPSDLSQPSKVWRHWSHHCYIVVHHLRPHQPKRLQRREEEPCLSCGHRRLPHEGMAAIAQQSATISSHPSLP